MKKILMFGILAIFLLQVIQSQVYIVPDPIEISGRVGTTLNYSILVNNTYNFNIYDLKFGNLSQLGFSFSNNSVNANSSKIINITINPTTSFSGSKAEKVEFRFSADIPVEVTTYQIKIKETGFYPRYITIRQGDTIIWNNTDTVFHNVFSSFFNQNIQPNQTFSYTFNQKGTFDYIDSGWDEFNFFHGVIEVIDRTSSEKVHNPDYDFIWNLNINFYLNPTQLEFEVLENNFTVSASGKTEGSLRIKNIGSVMAENIKLSSASNWIDFEENNFNLNSGEQNFVTFEISPLIFAKEDTGKTYNITLRASADNTEEYLENIFVFVPYSEIFADVNSAEYILGLLDKFCKEHPTNVFCNPPNQTVIYGNGTNETLTLNITAEDFFNLKRDISVWGTSLIRQGNDIQILSDQQETTIPEFYRLINESVALQKENQRKANISRDLRWIWGAIIFIVIGIFIIFNTYRKRTRGKSLLEGVYKYRG
jgi:plastocyanin